ncbi:MAG: hypothetical protein AUJ52_10415 [Elusimicrobia bacterium CG1_02_63_36]|nr:MAG: hypothetical protein AUJ52_10415 [Elusimicrobia bacterium CG1_02_63_36]PIP82342.1 MAG: hypothetical protein COR54_15355 [Elusimicrobia bacterium CG22_combo_CG10-13_8_21_14_all_63_91]PJA13972.1 MAG: hypothetical protein COX66_13800 [Elusimicrobia bacterium CG_4_10_14_0_2_um_filter_63_34]PJB25952.1 MAG: hypothetical protein CO113_06035 [Elusimicrobia bacterium CG_4_9_14_3_um_filter_62_55]
MFALYLVLAAMTATSLRAAPLEEKAGRLLMPTIDAAFVEAHAQEIRSGLLNAGMLAWDKHDATALRKLRRRLDALTGKNRRFLLAVDHEGGPLFTQRTAGLTIFPGNMALGATGDEVLAREAARISAQELAALGIDMVFAPVADVNSDPLNPIVSIRAFSDSPEVVARFTEYAVKGYEDGGVIPVLKHFPGHGDTDTDSHTGLPLIEKSAAALEKSDLIPFKKAIAAGAQAVMTAHIRVPSLGADEEPATLSRAVMTRLLRGRYGFKGVLVSDSLEMAAVAKRYPPAKSAVLAVEAGCDLLLTGRADTHAIRRALAGKIAEKALDAAGARIAALEKRPADYSMKKLRPPSVALRDIADRSVTLLRDRPGLLPLKASAKGLLFVVFRSKGFAEEGTRFEAATRKAFPGSKMIFLEPNPSKEAAAEAMRRAREAGTLIVSSYHWGMKPIAAQQTLIARMLQLGKPVVLISAMSPYDLLSYPEAQTAVLTYGFTAGSLEAAVRLLSGKIEPRGRLPVSLSGRLRRGDGLQNFVR